jgi:hypothetical protein
MMVVANNSQIYNPSAKSIMGMRFHRVKCILNRLLGLTSRENLSYYLYVYKWPRLKLAKESCSKASHTRKIVIIRLH